MDVVEQEKYYKLGKEYWWLAGKYQMVYNQLAALYPKSGAELDVLDMGCGPGNMTDYLTGFGDVVGSDLSEDALVYSKTRGNDKLFMGLGESLPLKDETFDLLVALDVLEHIDEEARATEELYRVIRPGGRLCMTVPAYQFLWGKHDDMYGHKRRYTAGEVRRKLSSAGFVIEKLTYFEAPFVPPLLVFRKLKNLLNMKDGGDDFITVPRWLNSLLLGVLSVEDFFLRYIEIPFGVTILCIARKEGSK